MRGIRFLYFLYPAFFGFGVQYGPYEVKKLGKLVIFGKTHIFQGLNVLQPPQLPQIGAYMAIYRLFVLGRAPFFYEIFELGPVFLYIIFGPYYIFLALQIFLGLSFIQITTWFHLPYLYRLWTIPSLLRSFLLCTCLSGSWRPENVIIILIFGMVNSVNRRMAAQQHPGRLEQSRLWVGEDAVDVEVGVQGGISAGAAG